MKVGDSKSDHLYQDDEIKHLFISQELEKKHNASK